MTDKKNKKKNKKGTRTSAQKKAKVNVKHDFCKGLSPVAKAFCKIENFIYEFENLQNDFFVIGLIIFIILLPILVVRRATTEW